MNTPVYKDIQNITLIEQGITVIVAQNVADESDFSVSWIRV